MSATYLDKQLSTNLLKQLPIDTFREDLQLRGRAEVTIKSYIDQVGRFGKYQVSQGRSLIDANEEDLISFLAYLRSIGLKSNSHQIAFAALASFYDYLEHQGQIEHNPIPAFRRRYLQQYKSGIDRDERRCISVEECSRLIRTKLQRRDQAILILLAKTGMRVHELTALDVADVYMQEKEIHLKPTPKRTNKTLFFDEEAAVCLQRWLDVRNFRGALFTGPKGRLNPDGVSTMVAKHSCKIGIADSRIGKDHISPHYFRIFFTTMLLRAGMPRHFVQELRGDVGRDAIDIYTRVDKEELRRSYLASIPQLGV